MASVRPATAAPITPIIFLEEWMRLLIKRRKEHKELKRTAEREIAMKTK
jgi:hypothetical protein